MSELWRIKPRTVHLDLINKCNACCVFCHYPLVKRPREPMPWDVFVSAVKQCLDLEVREIVPVLYGELFLLEDWFERCKYIEDNCKSAGLCIATNGSLLTDSVLDLLSKLGRLKQVNVSLNALNPEQHKQIMRIDGFHEIENAIARLRMKLSKRGTKILVSMAFDTMYHNEDDHNEFIERWGDTVANVFPTYCRDGYQKRIFAPTRRKCWTPWLNPVILNDGTVVLCCQDFNGEYPLGNVINCHLGDVWNSEVLSEIRHLHDTEERVRIPLCRQCMMANFNNLKEGEYERICSVNDRS